jgi:hypothetical protein
MVYCMFQSDLIWLLLLRGFVVGSPNLTPNPSFDQNTCISKLNEQSKVTLGIYISKKIQCYLGGPILHLFTFSTKVMNIWNFCMSETFKVRVHLRVIGFNFLHYPSLVRMCFIPKHFVGFMWPCTPHLVANLMFRLRHRTKV